MGENSKIGRRDKVRDVVSRLSPLGGIAAGFGAFNIALAVVDSSFSLGLLRLLVALLLGTTVGLAVVALWRHVLPPSGNVTGHAPRDALASSILAYGRELAATNKHSALVDLRNRASRMLHLVGARETRQELGELTLVSAAALADRLTQASVLTDDLGWSVFENGNTDEAAENIDEAIQLLTEQLDLGADPREQLLNLRAKAYRHMASIEAERRHFDLAFERIENAKSDAEQLPEPDQAIHLAQLDYTKSHLLTRQLDARVGKDGRIDPTSPEYPMLCEAQGLCEKAAKTFEAHFDLERAAKTAHLRCRIGRHLGPTALREAEASLHDAELTVSRNLRILKA